MTAAGRQGLGADLYDHVSELESLGLLGLAHFTIWDVDTGPTPDELEMLGINPSGDPETD